jgi:methionyl-tRNA synthetase
LRQWILQEHKDDWKINVVGQCKSWIDAGLQPRAVTRDLDWGIKVPAPPTPQRGELREKYSYETADPMTYGLLKKFVKEHRSNPTEAERVLWEQLRGKQLDGYKFRRQHIIGDYIADFVSLQKKLIIEVDGLIHQLPENKANDEERTLWLEKEGYTVIRFRNEEVLSNTENTLNKIIEVLQNLKGSKNPPLEGREAGKVLYVWFDAPIGYISATKQWAIDSGKDWKPYWYDKDTKLVHFIGKDNIVFHCIIFPVMLKLHGNILPDNVPANEFMNLEGDKMSTSRGWSIEMDEFINDWVKKDNGGDSMVDVLRYYLTTISPETKDSEFTWKGFQDAGNNELGNIFGNFVNRTFVMMHKLCKGKVPPLHAQIIDDSDKAMFVELESAKVRIEELIEQYKFRDALFEVIDLSRKGNKYMQDKQPWIVAKQKTDNGQLTTDAQQKVDNCMHVCLQLTANLAILCNPFLPFTAKKLCYMMKVVDKMLDWENAGKTKLLSVGYSLREPQILFRKIEDAEIAEQIEKLKLKSRKVEESKPVDSSSPLPVAGAQGAVSNAEQPVSGNEQPATNVKPEIVFDDFAKIDLKVGTIVSAEKVQKADKLLKLSIDLGFETRTIVSGIALHFQPEEIVGKQVTVVTNLAPRKMRGIESNGMILMAEDKAGKLHFINPEEKIDAGSGVS